MAPRTKAENLRIQEQSRQQILLAALQCFAELGYAHTSMARIAKEAGISKGLIYHYFDSKEALLDGIFQMMLQEADHIMEGWEEKTSKEKLRYTIEQSMVFIRQQTGIMRFMLSLAIQPEVTKNLKGFFEEEKQKRMHQFTALFEDLGYENPETEAYYMGAVLDGMAFGFISLPDEYPLDAMEEKLFTKYQL
ncbi:MAG TPA: hypothetical protein DCG19_12295 [Cryomorphaceae bacterium]|nr:hypothetical protein [Owenweeksia sp.]MBF99194.1 hypothetical protein [Owenweeksia sp.]HAD98181.1 hypothetical protein [Cryomorphaceae bacterium]HBF22010.1 hypothetical protein [Cryomorphaceae bacterium]HCQ16491.1 hypothetical protein [Cryomorphaceae bacterium]|tara:strand:- start:10560 stop:11135 length:576 start_codon:yes stop_codon:yes gene_type:complete